MCAAATRKIIWGTMGSSELGKHVSSSAARRQGVQGQTVGQPTSVTAVNRLPESEGEATSTTGRPAASDPWEILKSMLGVVQEKLG